MKLIDCFCCWYDLLGFGNDYEANGWTLKDATTLANYSRLKTFNQVSSYNGMASSEVIFTLNDGCARTYDLVEHNRTPRSIGRWLTSVVDSFNIINRTDTGYGHPGLRGVITYGNRLNFEHENVFLIDKVIGHPSDRERLRKTVHAYSPQQLQLNLAFSKAYFMESMGSKAGISGNNLFVDSFFLDKLSMLASEEHIETHFGDSVKNDDNTFSIPISKAKFKYRVEVKTEDSEEVYLIHIKNELGNEMIVFGMRLDATPVRFEFRGLATTLQKLNSFYPIDHEYPVLIDLNTANRWGD